MKNKLIARISPLEQARLYGECETVHHRIDEIVSVEGEPIDYLYFPLSAVFVVSTRVERAFALAIGFIGNEGVSNASLILGVNRAPFEIRVCKAGRSLRMTAEDVKSYCIEGSLLRLYLGQYVYATLQTLAQCAVCHHYHHIDARLATLLMTIHDRFASSTFEMTQLRLATLLGVRRVGITKSAQWLQAQHLIDYTRGHVTLLNLHDLRQHCCSCYRLESASDISLA